LIKGQILRPTEFNRITRKLLKSYEEEGYMLAAVDLETKVVNEKENRAELTVNIDEGPEVGIDRISFNGNVAFDDGDLRGAMDETSVRTWWKFWSSARFDRINFDKDKKLIIKKYREEGYLDAVIVNDSIWYSDDKRDLYIDITVDEGSRSYIRNIVWKGNTVYPDSILTTRLGFERGDVFNETRFDENLRGRPTSPRCIWITATCAFLRMMSGSASHPIPSTSFLRCRKTTNLASVMLSFAATTRPTTRSSAACSTPGRVIFSAARR
jgi:outer membrane protein insertion porin family